MIGPEVAEAHTEGHGVSQASELAVSLEQTSFFAERQREARTVG